MLYWYEKVARMISGIPYGLQEVICLYIIVMSLLAVNEMQCCRHLHDNSKRNYSARYGMRLHTMPLALYVLSVFLVEALTSLLLGLFALGGVEWLSGGIRNVAYVMLCIPLAVLVLEKTGFADEIW